MATENNSIPISDVNTKDPTMRMTEGDRVKITVYNSNFSKPPPLLAHASIHSGIMDGVAGMSGYSPGVIIQPNLCCQKPCLLIQRSPYTARDRPARGI